MVVLLCDLMAAHCGAFIMSSPYSCFIVLFNGSFLALQSFVSPDTLRQHAFSSGADLKHGTYRIVSDGMLSGVFTSCFVSSSHFE